MSATAFPTSTSMPSSGRACSRARAPRHRHRTTAPAGSTSRSASTPARTRPPTQRNVRVPPGVTVFDSASWNGIAIDSTCGGHGTCHKCKVRVEGGAPVTRHDVRTFSPDQIEAGWRLACLVQATRDLEVDVPPLTTRPKAATVGVGRQVILRPALQKRYVELDEPTLSDQRTDLERLTDAITDLELTADLPLLRRLGDRAAAGRLQGHRRDRRRGPDRRRARRHHRPSATRSPSTSAPPPSSRPCSTSAPAPRVAVASMLNKQQPFGGDVITRISATMMDPDDARPAPEPRPARPSPSSPSRCAARAASTRPASTRWRSPATRP